MSKNSLEKKIVALRNELDKIESDDPETREKLTHLISELEVKLDSPEQQNSLLETIKESISHFETEHPRATAIMNDIMVTLSNIGI